MPATTNKGHNSKYITFKSPLSSETILAILLFTVSILGHTPCATTEGNTLTSHRISVTLIIHMGKHQATQYLYLSITFRIALNMIIHVS